MHPIDRGKLVDIQGNQLCPVTEEAITGSVKVLSATYKNMVDLDSFGFCLLAMEEVFINLDNWPRVVIGE